MSENCKVDDCQKRVLVAALEQALDCILDETPEDMTREEAREDTIRKIREALHL